MFEIDLSTKRQVRFWNKVEKTDTCWNWIGSKCPRGYGSFKSSARTYITAHRYSWVLSGEPLIPGLVIDHLCMNKSCVRPSHLEQVTQSKNISRRRCRPCKNRRQKSWKNKVRMMNA